MKDKNSRELISQLLSKIPEVRLGGSYTSFKTHLFF